MEPESLLKLSRKSLSKPASRKRFWIFLALGGGVLVRRTRSAGYCFPFSFRQQSPSTLAG